MTSQLACGGVSRPAAAALRPPAGEPAGASPHRADRPLAGRYTAIGAQFKTIDARVFLRQPTQYASVAASVQRQLWSTGPDRQAQTARPRQVSAVPSSAAAPPG